MASFFSKFRRSAQSSAPQVSPPAATVAGEARADDPFDWLLGLFEGGSSLAGEPITSTTALSCSPVKAAVSIIATSMGSLPVHLFQPADDGAKEIPDDHPAIPLIEADANPWTSAGALRTQLTVDALLSGGGFGYVVRDSQGIPREIHRIAPQNAVTMIDLSSGEPRYRLTFDGQSFVASYRDVIHIFSPVQLDGIFASPPVGGLSTVASA